MSNFNKILKLQYGNFLISCLPSYINTALVTLNELTVIVNSKYINKVLSFLKNDSNSLFNVLIDITAVDYPENDKRFEVFYFLLSLSYNTRIRVKTHVNEMFPLESVTNIFSSANWSEREVWDMFGIYFKGHPDLRRLLTDYGFEGHPLRKDFPLNGYLAVRYDDTNKIILYEVTELSQSYRNFNLQSSWSSVSTFKNY
jgi:NADH dehydrogenase (ubiquinone) Fe-S protein 3